MMWRSWVSPVGSIFRKVVIKMTNAFEAQLIEPDGTIGLIVPIDYAVDWCSSHPGWTWRYSEFDKGGV